MSLIEEAFSFVSYMDVTEIRQAYYGRNNIYASFTDSIYYIKSGKDSGALKRPWAIVANTVNEVVARKVSTHYFYANILRVNKSKGWIEDIRNYNSSQFEKDIIKLGQMKFLEIDFVETVVDYVIGRNTTNKRFELLWDITKRLSKNDEMLWNKIFLELGYNGFSDQVGSGLFGTRNPCTLILTEDVITYLDTIPVQKYRKDTRQRIKDRIDQTQRLSMSRVKRNRIAKVQNRRR